MHSYQNGWITFTAKLSENETRIEDIVLKIYDSKNFNEPILVPDLQPGSSLYSPKWLIKEEDIMDSGESLFGSYYRTGYYTDKERYYYFVSITAYDKSLNEATLEERVEDQKFFCMWEQADEPKGIIDPIIGNTIYKRMTLPVQFFDDDSLDYAWVGLLTKAQWNGEKDIFDSGVKISGVTNQDKLNFLQNRLVNQGLGVYDWKYDDRYSGAHSSDSPSGNKERVKEWIGGKEKVDDYLVNIETGTKDNDNGEFVLFTITRDTKLEPHPASPGNVDTLKSRVKSRYYEINIIDDNVPLIVLDTVDTNADDYNASLHSGVDIITGCSTGNSPEENTFPLLVDGETFEINGYTLREKGGVTGVNKVERFRMAWIPKTILNPDNEKEIIKQVENALRWYRDPTEPGKQDLPENSFPVGVQYWVMDDTAYVGGRWTVDAPILTGTNVTISGAPYVKQVFRKKFSVIRDKNDDKKSSYKNFTYKNGLTEIWENETKVFVFCAIDNMQKVVYRTIRLLPNKTPPALSVYEITAKFSNFAGIPDVYGYNAAGNITPEYIAARQTFNNTAYATLKNVSVSDNDKSVPFQTYPRKTQVKYWVKADKTGDIAIDNITMQDVTTAGSPVPLGSVFNSTDRALSYIEYFPEVTSRVFLFTATDKLGNIAQIQRTIAITNAATLINITTEQLDGVYGIGNTITLKANFDGRIRIDGSWSDVVLNVRYAKRKAPPALSVEGDYVFKQIPCARVKDLSLEFDFVVSENDLGILQTLYDDAAVYFTHTDMNRPISLKNGAQITDISRNDQAFTPGNITGFIWSNSNYSLQEPSNGKQIELDGIRPRITGIAVSGKLADGGNYYFKGGETILFTITSDKDIRTSGTPRLQYQINGTGTTYNSYFNYKSPSGAKGMVFALEVSKTSLPNDGPINNFSLVSAATIVDDVGNSVDPLTVNVSSFNTMLAIPSSKIIYNDQTPPAKPVTTMDRAPSSPASPGNVGQTPGNIWYYNAGVNFSITAPPNEPYGQTLQYSLDGGIAWNDYSSSTPIPNGERTLQTRSTDRAGNIGAVTEQKLHINAAFPKITSVGVEQPKGTYTAAAGQNALTFVLNFADSVKVTTIGNVTITLTNRNNDNNQNTGGTNTPLLSYQIQLTANTGQTTNTTSIKFNWTGIGTTNNVKEMLDGLYISAINFTGLSDQFGNGGGTANATSPSQGNASVITVPVFVGNASSYTVDNLQAGYKVDAIPPRVANYNPTSGTALSAAQRRIITITFNEPMMKGSGTITVRPSGDSLIPPVFENYGYYLDSDGKREDSTGRKYDKPGLQANGLYVTYVDGFYDIYNNSALNAGDKNKLTKSESETSPSWGTLETNARTGQTVGPYQRLTQGLKEGSGYTGTYDNISSLPAYNYSGGITAAKHGPNPQTGFLVPDTDTKWVLDYKLRINDTTPEGPIEKINDVLKKAKFRWQEIDVASTTVSGNTVTITLNEPLLEGLHWDLYYPTGAFTDTAGNSAPAVTAASPHTFWTAGVQTPVIRVNRRSYDARAVGSPTLNDLSQQSSRGSYPTPPANTNWNVGTTVTDLNGWGIDDFNTIHYRIESETPGATLNSGIYGNGKTARQTNKASVTAVYVTQSGDTSIIGTGNANVLTGKTTSTWYVGVAAGDQNNGEWILSNLVRRVNSEYTVIENGNTVTRTRRTNYRGYRSYNSDATFGNLDGVGLTSFGNMSSGSVNQGTVSFDRLEAGKSYIVAQASRTGQPDSKKGFEGVFRTVIALANYNTTGPITNNASIGSTRPVMVEGSNIKNGMPSVAGFPVRDAEETGDNRYIKMFYRNGADPTNATEGNDQLLWVSTEIVCEWYFIKYGGRQNTSTHMSAGEVNNYLMVGYGDLTYAINIASSQDPNP
jgi:hypothetical protein